jgi:antitoxin CptB
MTENQDQAEEIRRLRWQCRRGMLELDVALRRFLDEDYSSLNSAEQATFARLLEAQDQTLHGWLMGRAVPEEADVRTLVARIRAFGRGPRAS